MCSYVRSVDSFRLSPTVWLKLDYWNKDFSTNSLGFMEVGSRIGPFGSPDWLKIQGRNLADSKVEDKEAEWKKGRFATKIHEPKSTQKMRITQHILLFFVVSGWTKWSQQRSTAMAEILHWDRGTECVTNCAQNTTHHCAARARSLNRRTNQRRKMSFQ